MLRISAGQLAPFVAAAALTIEEMLDEHVQTHFPELAELGCDVRGLILEARARADEYGFSTVAGYKHFINFMILAGVDFDRTYRSDKARRVRQALGAGARDPDERIEAVYRFLEATL